MDIIGLGTVAMDVILQVDALPHEDGFALIKDKQYLEGGSASNVIVQASRLGAKCGFISQIGDDEVGNAIKSGLDKENIETSTLIIKKNGTSLHTTIVVGENGKKFILLNMGDTFLSFDKKDVDINFIKSGKIFYTDLLPREASIFALSEANNAGLKTVFNLQIGLPLMEQFGVKKEDILNALTNVDVFAPCRESFTQLIGTEDYLEGIKSFMQNYNGILLLTLGSEGSVATDGKQIVKVPARKVEAKDTTGAGDSYIGAFMFAFFVKQMGLKQAMEFSTAAASITCKGIGARTSPGLKQVEEVLQG
ncbi:MAG: carbohydrate kinase family protein [Ignavibacteriaceae bacterium]|nr:carbohydrate kinase family protein [Ignavibacteriaceae bacterium]